MAARVLALTLMAVVSVAAIAAEAPAPAAPSPAAPAAGDAPAAAPAPPAPAPEVDLGPPGDLVTLKSGRTYRGFQVLKSTSAEVVLEVTPEVTLTVPRRQIVSIEYDDIDPTLEAQKRKEAAAAAEKAASALLAGQKVSPAIQAKLAADISTPPFTFDKRFIGEVVTELNKLPQIKDLIEVDKSVKKLPEEKRRWTIHSVPGMTMAAVIEDLKKSLPHLATIIRDDKLVITDQNTARELLGGQPPAPSPGAAPAAPAPAPASGTTAPPAAPPAPEAATPPPAAPAPGAAPPATANN